MSDNAKTGIFLALAFVFLLVAWFARPATPGREAFDDSHERFFAEFDPLEATSLEIVSFDEDRGSIDAFKVAQVDGLWSIPSHENYPADAEDQLAQAAAGVVDLIRGPAVSDRLADHELYGVLDPVEAPPGADGVGMRVTLADATGTTLADLIIGRAEEDNPDLYFTRQPGRDRVYRTQLSTDALSTRFEDWIEDDLLKLDLANTRRIIINDYSIDELNQRIAQGDVLDFNWSDEDRAWRLDSLAANENLDTAKLDALKKALDDLRIIDVHRKPEGLSRELRAVDEMTLDREAISSLRSRGYFVVNGQLLSNEGETLVGTSEGVEYALRFGEITLRNVATAETEDNPEGTGNNRYLFVTATFNEALISKPDLAPLPDLPVDAGDDAEKENADAARLLQQTRERIESDNGQKRVEYDQKIEAGREKVRQLNDRFADWYYVIANSVYEKIRLRRSDVVTVIEADPAPESSAPPLAEDADDDSLPPEGAEKSPDG